MLVWLVPTSALAVALVAALIAVTRPRPVSVPEPVELASADRASTELMRVPTQNPDVVFYWVGHIDEGSPR